MERHLFRPGIEHPRLCNTCNFEQTATFGGEAMIPMHTNPDAKMTITLPFSPEDVGKDDPINPSHYSFTSTSFNEVSDAWGLSFRLAFVLKYIQRHQRKGEPLQDLEKAQWYLTREIERMKNEPPRS